MSFVLSCLIAAPPLNARPLEWPGWRGPERTSLVPGNDWPADLDGMALRWRLELGPGYSGPVITDARVFVTETKDRRDEVVTALDRATGREIWRQQWPGAMTVPFFARENGDWIRATPAYDGDSLYVAGMRDVLVCLGADDGSVRWKIDFVEKFQSSLPTFGYVSSPLIVGDHLYVQAGSGFCKIDKKSGEIVWRTLNDGGGMMGSAFSSPIMATLADRPQLVVQTRMDLAGVDPETGDVLWRQPVPNFRGMNILTPILHEGGIFTSTYQRNSFLFRIEREGDAFKPVKAWENKLKGYMSTPVLIDGHVYLHLQNQRLACIRLADGEITWVSSRRFGRYWSMVAQGRRILALDEDGTLYLLEADPKELRLIAEKKLSDQETWGHIAIAGRDILVRELNAVACWHWGDATK